MFFLGFVDHFEALGSAPGIVNPFEHTAFDCWTLVDFDRDGDLDPCQGGACKPLQEKHLQHGGLAEKCGGYYENATWNRC